MVLHALRVVQERRQHNTSTAACRFTGDHCLFHFDAAMPPLDDAEIDLLCERLNDSMYATEPRP
jgi:hypothetical protein